MYTGSGTASKQYYHADYAGSIVAMSDASGNLVDSYTYGPYGETNDPTGNPFRYTGRRVDPETGLYYYRARYYSPAIGRFLQTDPIGYGDNMNMYTYVGNDPVNAIDPFGLAKLACTTVQGNPKTCTVYGHDPYSAFVQWVQDFLKNLSRSLEDGARGAVDGLRSNLSKLNKKIHQCIDLDASVALGDTLKVKLNLVGQAYLNAELSSVTRFGSNLSEGFYSREEVNLGWNISFLQNPSLTWGGKLEKVGAVTLNPFSPDSVWSQEWQSTSGVLPKPNAELALGLLAGGEISVGVREECNK